jgi:hypothetical protein
MIYFFTMEMLNLHVPLTFTITSSNVFPSLELTEVMNSSLVGFCADGASNMQGTCILIYQQFWGDLVPSVKG